MAVYVNRESQVGEESGTKYIGVDRSVTCCHDVHMHIVVSGLLFANYGQFGHWTIRTSRLWSIRTLDDSDLGRFLPALSIRTLPLEGNQVRFRYGCAARHFKTHPIHEALEVGSPVSRIPEIILKSILKLIKSYIAF